MKSDKWLEFNKYWSEGVALPLVFAGLPIFEMIALKSFALKQPRRVVLELDKNGNPILSSSTFEVLASLLPAIPSVKYSQTRCLELAKWLHPPTPSLSASVGSSCDQN